MRYIKCLPIACVPTRLLRSIVCPDDVLHPMPDKGVSEWCQASRAHDQQTMQVDF